MARKAKSEETVVEVQDVAVAEAPKTTKKKTKKAADPVEETPVVEEAPVVEEVPAVEEAPAVEETPVVDAAPEVVEEKPVEEKPAKVAKAKAPKAEKKPAEKKAAFEPYTAVTTTALNVMKTSDALSKKVGSYNAGAKVYILEENNGWGRVGLDRWVSLAHIQKI